MKLGNMVLAVFLSTSTACATVSKDVSSSCQDETRTFSELDNSQMKSAVLESIKSESVISFDTDGSRVIGNRIYTTLEGGEGPTGTEMFLSGLSIDSKNIECQLRVATSDLLLGFSSSSTDQNPIDIILLDSFDVSTFREVMSTWSWQNDDKAIIEQLSETFADNQGNIEYYRTRAETQRSTTTGFALVDMKTGEALLYTVRGVWMSYHKR